MNIQKIYQKFNIEAVQSSPDFWSAECPSCKKMDAIGQPYPSLTIDEHTRRCSCSSCKRAWSMEEFENEFGDKKEKTEQEQPNNNRESKADKLMRVLEQKQITYFHSLDGESWIEIAVNGVQNFIEVDSQIMRRLLNKFFYEEFRSTIDSQAINAVIAQMSARGLYEGDKREVFTRSAMQNSNIWYDLNTKDGEIVHIDSTGWRVQAKSPVPFRRRKNIHGEQVLPSRVESNIHLVDKHLPFQDKERQILVKAWLVSSLVPNISRYLLYLYGQQGGAKSTTTRLLRSLIDPSVVDTTQFPKKPLELIQQLSHAYMPSFDNVSFLNKETSDILCRAVTGGSVTKRKLYTNDEDFIYKYQKAVIVNGINVVAIAPDLLDRTLLIELERIPKNRRKTERELYDSFNRDKPIILAGIFEVLSRAISIIDQIQISQEMRLIDAVQWGTAVTIAMGYPQEAFEKALRNNRRQQDTQVIKSNPLAHAICVYMSQMQEKYWKGTATDLKKELEGMHEFHAEMPKSPSALSRKLSELRVNLKNIGLDVEFAKHISREVTITKKKEFTPLDDIDGNNSYIDRTYQAF